MLGHYWRPLVAGLCGSLAHTALMAFKSWTGFLPSFQPYRDLQAALTALAGTSVPAAALWLITYFNGAVVLGFIFARVHRLLPGRSGVVRGLFFGVVVWALMGAVVFPLLGKGLFASAIGLGFAPALFSLVMVLVYSVALGVVYAILVPDRDPAV